MGKRKEVLLFQLFQDGASRPFLFDKEAIIIYNYKKYQVLKIKILLGFKRNQDLKKREEIMFFSKKLLFVLSVFLFSVFFTGCGQGSSIGPSDTPEPPIVHPLPPTDALAVQQNGNSWVALTEVNPLIDAKITPGSKAFVKMEAYIDVKTNNFLRGSYHFRNQFSQDGKTQMMLFDVFNSGRTDPAIEEIDMGVMCKQNIILQFRTSFPKGVEPLYLLVQVGGRQKESMREMSVVSALFRLGWWFPNLS